MFYDGYPTVTRIMKMKRKITVMNYSAVTETSGSKI